MCADGPAIPEGFALVTALADAADQPLTVAWGRVAVRLGSPVDLAGLRSAMSGAGGVSAAARFGEFGDVELSLSDGPPDGSALRQLQAMAPSEGVRLQLLNPADGWAAAAIADELLHEVIVEYRENNWCATIDAFADLVEREWTSLVQWFVPGTVRVGAIEIGLEHVAPESDASVLAPAGERPPQDGDHRQIWDLINGMADAHAWSLLATDVDVTTETPRVALHRDQPTVVPVSPASAAGGVALWRWTTATDDANRVEAVRHVLRLVTANSPRLPDGDAMVALAERHRIALARENAAEVQRAIHDGRASTRLGLADARSALTAYTDDTVKTAQATVVAAIGVVALVARNEDALETRLLVVIMVTAAAAVATVVVSRWRRMGDVGADVQRLSEALSAVSEPLLPEEDRGELQTSISAFNVGGRIAGARAVVAAFGLAAAVIIVAAGVWILADSETSPVESPVVAVEGFVRIEGGIAELCSELVGEDPPMCHGDRWILRDLPAAVVVSLSGDEAVQWDRVTRTVVGAVEDGVLNVVSVSG